MSVIPESRVRRPYRTVSGHRDRTAQAGAVRPTRRYGDSSSTRSRGHLTPGGGSLPGLRAGSVRLRAGRWAAQPGSGLSDLIMKWTPTVTPGRNGRAAAGRRDVSDPALAAS
eukprot:223055-Hanusia_phi.AAC.1